MTPFRQLFMSQLRKKAIIRNTKECKKGKEKGLERDLSSDLSCRPQLLLLSYSLLRKMHDWSTPLRWQEKFNTNQTTSCRDQRISVSFTGRTRVHTTLYPVIVRQKGHLYQDNVEPRSIPLYYPNSRFKKL